MRIVHLRATNSRCERSSVDGVITRTSSTTAMAAPGSAPPTAPGQPALVADEQPAAPAPAADAGAARSRSPSPARSESGARRARAVAAWPNTETTEPRLETTRHRERPYPVRSRPSGSYDADSVIRVFGTHTLLPRGAVAMERDGSRWSPPISDARTEELRCVSRGHGRR